MWIYLQNIIYAIATLMGFALAGDFAIAPFRRHLRYPFLCAPLAGILLTTMGSLSGYVLFRLPMRTAGLCAWLCCCCLTFAVICAARKTIDWRKATLAAVLMACLTAIQTTVLSTACMRTGGSAMVYMDGTDHLGYAHLADCLRTRPIALGHDFAAEVMKGIGAVDPYEDWPLLLTLLDPRFGCFTFLSLISILTHRSGMFAYDLGCAIALSAGILALSGLFARNRVTLLLLLAGLFTCHWFDYSRCGFFAKILAYPSSFFVAGLFFLALRSSRNSSSVVVLLLLVESAALVQSGLSTALFLAILGGGFICASFAFGRDPFPRRLERFNEGATFLFGLISVSVVTSGVMARPLHGFLTNVPDLLSWDYIYPRLSEIESQATNLSGFSEIGTKIAVLTCLVLWIVVIGIAFYRRYPLAIALSAGPLILLIAVRLVNANWVAFQLIGVFYPLAFCGAAVLAAPVNGEPESDRRYWHLKALPFGILFVALLLHLPRFWGAYNRYAGPKVPIEQVFQKDQFDRLATELGGKPVFVDISDAHAALAVMVELGRRHQSIQWSPGTWNLILAYTKRPPPIYEVNAIYRLVPVETSPPPGWDEVCKTNQFLLLKFVNKLF